MKKELFKKTNDICVIQEKKKILITRKRDKQFPLLETQKRGLKLVAIKRV
jgi:hypothetical protein